MYMQMYTLHASSDILVYVQSNFLILSIRDGTIFSFYVTHMTNENVLLCIMFVYVMHHLFHVYDEIANVKYCGKGKILCI